MCLHGPGHGGLPTMAEEMDTIPHPENTIDNHSQIKI